MTWIGYVAIWIGVAFVVEFMAICSDKFRKDERKKRKK